MATHAQTKLRVGICARTVSMGVGSPFAIAMKMGWFKQEGLDTGWAWSEDLRRKVRKDALSGLEDSVAWVKEQSYLELIHKTSTIRVIG